MTDYEVTNSKGVCVYTSPSSELAWNFKEGNEAKLGELFVERVSRKETRTRLFARNPQALRRVA